VQKDSTEQNATSYSPSVQQKEVQTLDKDIRFIKTNPSTFQSKQDYFFGSFAHILCLLFPCLVFAFVWYTKSSRDQLRANAGLYRKSKANKVALARMMSAKNAMDANNDLFYEEMYKGVLGYISDTFTIETSDLNQERIQWHLRNASISEEMVQEAMQLVSYVEMARFSPVQELSKPALYQKSLDFIEKMERTKSKKA
jgi:hypothetical protein